MVSQIRGTITGQALVLEQDLIVTGTKSYLTADFTFSPEWAGMSIWAKFSLGSQHWDINLHNGKVTQEDRLNLTTGTWELSLLGLDPNGLPQITTEPRDLRVRRTNVDPLEPLPEVPATPAEQIDRKAQQALDTAEDVKRRADEGEFDFRIEKVYPSVAAMEADFSNPALKEGANVLIETGNPEDVDNSKWFVKGPEKWEYVGDLSGEAGIRGPQGFKFTPKVTRIEDGIEISWENDGGLPNPEPQRVYDYTHSEEFTALATQVREDARASAASATAASDSASAAQGYSDTASGYASDAQGSATAAAGSVTAAAGEVAKATEQVSLAKAEVQNAAAQVDLAKTEAMEAANQVKLAQGEVTEATTQAQTAKSEADRAKSEADRSVALGLTATAPGDLIKVKSVGPGGVPTAWEKTSLEELEGKWELINTVTVGDAPAVVTIDTDSNGKPFKLSNAVMWVYITKVFDKGVLCSLRKEGGGAIIVKRIEKNVVNWRPDTHVMVACFKNRDKYVSVATSGGTFSNESASLEGFSPRDFYNINAETSPVVTAGTESEAPAGTVIRLYGVRA